MKDGTLIKKRIIVTNLKEFFYFGFDHPFAILAVLESEVYNRETYTKPIKIDYGSTTMEFSFSELRIDKSGLSIVKYKFEGF